MHISARDLARFGYLFQRVGVWGDRRIISEEWIRLARTPGVNPNYGFMNWFLNRPVDADGKAAAKPIPAAPESSVTFRGAGANIVYIDWENDLLVVVRWIGNGLPEFIEKVLGAIQSPPRPTETGALPSKGSKAP
jgi:CubicO group peptidase (beta-lactamase class C family)